MADLSSKDSSGSVKIVGADSDGIETNYVQVDDFKRLVVGAEIMDGPQLDAFGRPRMSELSVFYSEHFSDDAHAEDWPQLLANGGTLTYNKANARKDLTVNTTSGSRAVTQSRRYFQYLPGQSIMAIFTGLFAAPKTNVRQRAGLFDDEDGLAFITNDTDYGIMVRTSTSGSPVDTTVMRSSWNLDALDGTGPSGLNVDFTKGQILIIDYEWLGYGRIRFGVMVDGRIYYCHKIDNFNELTSPYMQRGSLPVRYEIVNVGATASSTTLRQGCVSLIGEGRATIGKGINAVSNGTTTVNIGAGSFTNLLAVRLQSTYKKAELIPEDVAVFTGSNITVYYEVVANATITGGAWTAQGIAEYNTTSTNATGGKVIAAGYLNTSQKGFFSNSANQFRLGFDTLNNTADTILIRARTLGGNGSAVSTMSLREIY